jgi:fatty acid synthase
MGKLKAIEKFDGQFFGLYSKMGDTIEPQSRILLETTYEAICDAGKHFFGCKLKNFINSDLNVEGINPQTLAGTETGVYLGFTTVGLREGLVEDIQPDLETSIRESLFEFIGNAKSLYANRISFIFDLRGPSMVIDTVCSSSMVAMDIAITDLRLGIFSSLQNKL